MTDNLTIRPAKKEDFDQIFELTLQIEEIYQEPLENLRKSKNLYKIQFEEILNKKDVFIYVAELSGNVVAYVTYHSSFAVWNAYYNSWEITELCVDKNFRSQKIGTKIFNYLENIAKKENVFSFQVNFNIIRKDAHRFYLNNGFKNVGYRFEKELN